MKRKQIETRKNIYLFWLICLFFLCTNAFALNWPITTQPQQLIYSQTPLPLTDLNKPITVHSNQPRFSIVLTSNPTTGYRWFLNNYDLKMIRLINSNYVRTTETIGGGGQEQWLFEILPAGFKSQQSLSLSFQYKRPWEHAIAKQQLIRIVTVP